MPFVTSWDTTSLFVADWGDRAGRPVMFAHAWGLNRDMWSGQLPDLLDAGYRCVTFDRRGHGRSDRPGHGYDIDTLSDDLAAVVDELDLSDTVLVGHSMGAAEVMRYLTRHGTDRTVGVVFSAPVMPMLRRAPDNPDGVEEAVFAASRAAMRADIGAFVDAVPASVHFGSDSAVSQLLVDWNRRAIVDTPLPVLLATQRAFTALDMRAELAALDLPTLVIQGSADRSAPIELTGRRVASLVPASRLTVVDNAGHFVHTGATAAYNDALLSFLREVDLAPGAAASTRGGQLSP